MKKLISIALAVLMLISVMPLAIFAEGNTSAASADTTYGNTGAHNSVLETDAAKVAEGFVCRIGTTYYTSLKAAYDALPSGNDTSIENKASITVTLIADLKETDLAGSKAMIVEGNGYSFNTYTTRAFTWTNADLTVKNLTIAGTAKDARSVQFHPNSSVSVDVVFENCTIVGNSVTTNVDDTFAAIVINGTSNLGTSYAEGSNLTFKNCTIETNTNAATNNMYHVSVGVNSSVTFEGCTFKVNGEVSELTSSVVDGATVTVK